MSVVWAARKAASFSPIWNKDAFGLLFGVEDYESNRELKECSERLYRFFKSSQRDKSKMKKPVCIKLSFDETKSISLDTLREDNSAFDASSPQSFAMPNSGKKLEELRVCQVSTGHATNGSNLTKSDAARLPQQSHNLSSEISEGEVAQEKTDDDKRNIVIVNHVK